MTALLATRISANTVRWFYSDVSRTRVRGTDEHADFTLASDLPVHHVTGLKIPLSSSSTLRGEPRSVYRYAPTSSQRPNRVSCRTLSIIASNVVF